MSKYFLRSLCDIESHEGMFSPSRFFYTTSTSTVCVFNERKAFKNSKLFPATSDGARRKKKKSNPFCHARCIHTFQILLVLKHLYIKCDAACFGELQTAFNEGAVTWSLLLWMLLIKLFSFWPLWFCFGYLYARSIWSFNARKMASVFTVTHI